MVEGRSDSIAAGAATVVPADPVVEAATADLAVGAVVVAVPIGSEDMSAVRAVVPGPEDCTGPVVVADSSLSFSFHSHIAGPVWS